MLSRIPFWILVTALSRDGDFLAPPQMPLPEQHVGHPVVARVDQEALHLSDLTVQSMDVVTVADFCFPQRNHILDASARRVVRPWG